MRTNGILHLYPFLRVALFFIAGIVAGTFLFDKVPVLVWLAAAVCMISAYVPARRSPLVQSWLVLLVILTLGAALASMRRSEAEMSFPESMIVYRAVITSRPVAKGKTVRCDMTVIGLTSKPFKIKASFARDEGSEHLRAGSGIEAFSRIKQPENYAKSIFDYRRYLLFHGYKGTAYIQEDSWRSVKVSLQSLSTVERVRLRALVFREKLLEHYRNLGIAGQDHAVLSAMTLGDKTTISAALADDYSVSGAAHVLALSGLHMGIIFTVLTFLLSRLRVRAFSMVLVVLAIWAYVFIVGMSPSVIRASVMLTTYTFVSLLNRERLSLNTLSIAAVVLLAVSPLDLFDAGFQMSFLSVLFILLFYRPLYSVMPCRWRRIKPLDWLWQMTCVSLTAQLGVAPLVAFYFGRFSCYFLLTNLLVIPLATLILYFAVLLVLTSPVSWLQSMVAVALFRLTKWLNEGVSFIASWPGASIEGININVFQTFCCYGFIVSVCLFLWYLRRVFWFSHRPLDYMNLPKDS